MSLVKSGLKKVYRVAAVAALTGAVLGVTGVGSASAGTSKGHLMLGVVSSSQWTGTKYAYPHSASIVGKDGSIVCYKVSAGSWTKTNELGTFSYAITLYTSSNCGLENEIGWKNVPADTSSNDNYWYAIDQSNMQDKSWS